MIVRDFERARRRVLQLLDEPPAFRRGSLVEVARRILGKRAEVLALASRRATPFYAFDPASFADALSGFARAFAEHVPRHAPFYAVKSNHHPDVVRVAADSGFGLDVSSGRELAQALRTKARQILFSGPAKSAADLELAVANAERATVNLDSFGELRRLGDTAARFGREVRAGVRIHTSHQGSWSKFGIPLEQLGAFWREASTFPAVRLEGIQFHSSWSPSAEPYTSTIRALAEYLRAGLEERERSAIRFIDFGGGFRPFEMEGYYPAELPLGTLITTAAEHYGEPSEFVDRYYIKDSIPVPQYAREIGDAIAGSLRGLVDCDYFSEPGRVVSTFAMHLVFRVVDCKSDQIAIVDGGIHMVGWEKYLHVYAPLVNLSRPSEQELPVRVYGSLCDPEDVLGFYCFAEEIREGDVLVLPFQGAYTHCVAQNFIRPVPPVYRLPRRRTATPVTRD